VYRVELVPLGEVVKKVKVSVTYVEMFDKDVAERGLKRLKLKLDVISQFSWDYQVNVDSPPK
jgi:hypothetical protein